MNACAFRSCVVLIFSAAVASLAGSAFAQSRPSTTLASSLPATMPAGPLCMAIMETEVVADLPADDRKIVADSIDVLLTESAGKQSNFRLVDRQALNKILEETASKLGGLVKVDPGEVAETLRPFWSAGVLICSTVTQVKPDSGKTPQDVVEVTIEIDAVLAQTGQPLGEVLLMAKWQSHRWQTPPSLESPLKNLWAQLPHDLREAMSDRFVEIADVRLVSPLRRLQWMADDLCDGLKSSLTQPGVALLTPRHPSSTTEERLLRVMGLSSPNGKDASASLTCSPNFGLDVEITEEVGKDLDYDKTPIMFRLSLQARVGDPATQTFSGKASEYAALSRQASAWLSKQLALERSEINEALDEQRARQAAGRELEAARQLRELCSAYGNGWNKTTQQQVLRAKVLERAMRAAHLDPTNEEAARLVVLGLDSPYWLRGVGRSNACYDRVIAEGQRYLERFDRDPHAEEVRSQISGYAFQQLSEMRQRGDGHWSSLAYDPEIYRYAKVDLLSLDRDIRGGVKMNLWAHANVVGQCVFMHCRPDKLEDERTYWRNYWAKNIEPLNGGPENGQAGAGTRNAKVPPWDFVELYYFIRKKDTAALRVRLNQLARKYPRSDQSIWWGTRTWEGQPAWKSRVQKFLQQGGDPDWKTWEPTFASETFDWGVYAYGEFLSRFNPPMPLAWDIHDARPLPADRISLAIDHPVTATDREKGFRPLLSAGGYLWLCQPPPGEDLNSKRNLLLIPMDELRADGKDLHVQARAIDWPAYPSGTGKDLPGEAVRCWLTTLEDQTPTVWIGTAWHGLARFDFKDRAWHGRWYAAQEGVPGEDILLVRPCVHEGKPKLLVLSQPRNSFVGRQDIDKFLWVLDPPTGQVKLIASSKSWATIWFTFTKAPTYLRLIALWNDGTKVPLCLYNRDDFPKLDVAGIAGLERPDYEFMLGHDRAHSQVYGMGSDGLVQFDSHWTPQRLLEGAQIADDIYYRSPVDGGGPIKLSELLAHRDSPVWTLLQTPLLDVRCISDNPVVVWSAVGSWDEVRRGCNLLAAYRPAANAPFEDNDTWYGPWRTETAILSLDFIDDRLWLVTTGGSLYRFRPMDAIRSAQTDDATRSTLQWRSGYRKHLESSWLNAVRMEITAKEYDKALSTIATVRSGLNGSTRPSIPAANLVLWEALTLARKGDFAAADRLYATLADDTKVESLARGIALINLVNVRHASKDWPRMNEALEKLMSLFPGLNSPKYFSEGRSMQWYRDHSRQDSPTSKSTGP